MCPHSDIFGPQNANNSTCSQSSSKRKLYYNSNDILLYLTPNKVHVRCFGVLASIKSGLRFYVNLETDKKASWRPQEAEKVPTESFWDDCGPQVETKRGPRSTPNRLKRQKTRATIDNTVLSASSSSCGRNKPTFSRLGRFNVDLGSI